MLDQILSLDQRLFVFLNGLGSETFDGFWLLLTKQANWTPFFILLLYYIHKKIGTKQTFVLVLFVAGLLLFTDQITNLFKYSFQRLRPCNNQEIHAIMRVVKTSSSFSFFSGHAANTTAVATFLYLNFKKDFKYLGLLFLWPLVFSYSRIYLGLHYPLDIVTGYFFGALFGFFFFKMYQITQIKYFPL